MFYYVFHEKTYPGIAKFYSLNPKPKINNLIYENVIKITIIYVDNPIVEGWNVL